MKQQHIRIFITPSHICTAYINLFAKHTKKENQKDILFIDASKRRKSLAQLIKEASTFYKWDMVHDFSVLLDETYDYKPGSQKKLTRKIKNWPIIRNIYSILLKQYLNKKDKKYIELVREILGDIIDKDDSVSIFALTQTYINKPLLKLFPDAQTSFIEHGIGDYYMLLDKQNQQDHFHCVFAESFRTFVKKRNLNPGWIHALPGLTDFSKTAREILDVHKKNMNLQNLEFNHENIVVILMEAVDMYLVPDSFWSDYINHILAQLEKPEAYHYILKPHPMQSVESIEKTEIHLKNLGLSYSIPPSGEYTSISAEVVFALWADKTKHVFCLFSSACFYLSELYKDKPIQFWYSTNFMGRYIGNAPSQFKKQFEGLVPLIDSVFTGNCKSF